MRYIYNKNVSQHYPPSWMDLLYAAFKKQLGVGILKFPICDVNHF